MENYTELLSHFQSISLPALIDAQLMNRVDTKFVFRVEDLPELLIELQDKYHVLVVNQQRIANYENIYFDTPSKTFYLDHHNGKDHRYKVRYRKYGNSDNTFFEVKERCQNRTIKRRIQVDKFQHNLGVKATTFLIEKFPELPHLDPQLLNTYQRITLVNEELMERFTLDLNISFQFEGKSVYFENIVIAELKQAYVNRNSFAYQYMKKQQLRPSKLSKYCLGTLFTFDQPIKYNNFKYSFNKLKALNNAS
ncbi:transporter [Brumimicrobium salinarum]|uniref:Transporter n=1 Tax=Brumimicrobium salinarum TaxID=2058658 RepID=A0A2I0R398_9FLAO|nr:polyphosphate polymerase domain-containing protein [Brumimicrobium salinarum]PKR81058.1 transporter [Brumimicrobium salinarum]